MPRSSASLLDSRPHAVDPQLDRVLRRAVVLGALAVLLIPAARGHSDWLGWMPLWLLGMPLVAWWALHRFPLPARPRRRSRLQARRRVGPQARRRPVAAGLARAA
ncbi:hypothetical protein [Pseudoxanthomonas composti]|uniref:Transmembrane protein n=1 Tax=Pseudoxanthomonas composti TaxID=2137479 RepID=A0A4V1N0M3_9GAMM|nr:hypothetical protein [Pseudoxanthomonas composti]RXQ98744.1 hypothetical protein EPA99_18380 [Pseudoxanthomonas composti]